MVVVMSTFVAIKTSNLETAPKVLRAVLSGIVAVALGARKLGAFKARTMAGLTTREVFLGVIAVFVVSPVIVGWVHPVWAFHEVFVFDFPVAG